MTPRHFLARSTHDLAPAVLALGAALGACARVDHTRTAVDALNFHGARQVSPAAIADHLATRQSPRIPVLNVRSPFSPPEYYDEVTFRQDLRRIVRIYETQGFYSAAVEATRITPTRGTQGVAIDVTVREGEPTHVVSVEIPGCDPGPDREGSHWPLPERVCAHLRAGLQLRNGVVFTEAAFHADQQWALDAARDAGRGTARVDPSVTVDPEKREARVVYRIDPGPPARFGSVDIVEGANDRGPVNGILPSGYPVNHAHAAVRIRAGQPYSRTAIARAQRSLFSLGVFGIVRVEEVPHLCDSHGACDDARDANDPQGYARVDLKMHVTGVHPFRLRVGAGVEADMLRSDVHLSVAAEHRNFLGGMRDLRIDERPLLFFPSVFGAQDSQGFDLGNALSLELRQPGGWHGGTFVLSGIWDFGPDPFNPTVTDRSRVSTAIGLQEDFGPKLHAAGYARFTRVDFYNSLFGGQRPLLEIDPIYKSEYRPASQTYAYLEQQLIWDDRDSATMTRRGTYLAGTFQEGVPVFGQYAFLRGQVEARGFLHLGGGFVLAARGGVGVAMGLGSEVNGWPVPEELRFHSGGANSNRGYPYNRVGPLVTTPGVNCTVAGVETPYYQRDCRNGRGTEPYSLYVQDHNAVPDTRRTLSVGGLTEWEASVELRWYLGAFGAVLFFDASDVGGWNAPTYDPNDPTLRRPDPIPSAAAASSQTPTLPGATTRFTFDPHPSAGIGVRYITPVGVVRIDIGVRLDDLGCTAWNNQVAAENTATLGQPWYYTTTRPRCDVFNLPLGINLALGEAY